MSAHEASRDPLIGRVLDGRYRVERFVGGGGMGRVYEAVQVELGRRVALKVLIPELARQPVILERFRREAQAAGVLASPHIVDVTDFVIPEEGPPFLVMEHLVGESLTAVLERQGKLPIARARSITVQLLDGLQEAHDAGIIHRDLKPDNVFLQSLADGHEMVKLLDFGVAKLTEANPGGPQLTAVGALVGTPRFASPEQLRGGPVDARTDVYGAGVLLYGMLTGRPPFTGPVADLIRSVLSDDPPDVRIVSPEVDPHLASVVTRAMSKRPEDRFASADEMMRALGGRRAKAPRTAAKVADVPRAKEKRKASDEGGSPTAMRVAIGVASVLAALALATATGWAGYRLGGSEDDAPPPVTGAGAPSGACDAYLQAACVCTVEGACESANARLAGLRATPSDPSREAALEGWCRVALESGDACVAPPLVAVPAPTALDGSSHYGALTPTSWRRDDGSHADRFALSLTQDRGIEITMRGERLDAHLVLIAPSGRVVGASEASATGRRAKIVYVPAESGPHVLEVGAAPEQAGDYELLLDWGWVPAPAPRAPTRPRLPPTDARRPPPDPGGAAMPAPWPP